MNEESIKQNILWYLKRYEGRYSNTKETVIKKLIIDDCNKNDYNYYNSLFTGAFFKLVREKRIEIIPFDNLKEQQQFESEHRNEVFYRIND